MLFHVNKHEENEMNYFQCNQCQSRFKKKERLEQHMLKKHSDFECETCGKKFPEQGTLKEHVRVCLLFKSFWNVQSFFVFRFTQGKDHISARNAVQPLASSQTSSHTGLKPEIQRRHEWKSLFQENALPRAGAYGRGGKTPALLLLWHLRQELRQQGKISKGIFNLSKNTPKRWDQLMYF